MSDGCFISDNDFFPPGIITIDGHDIRDLNPYWLRNHIGTVSQVINYFLLVYLQQHKLSKHVQSFWAKVVSPSPSLLLTFVPGARAVFLLYKR